MNVIGSVAKRLNDLVDIGFVPNMAFNRTPGYADPPSRFCGRAPVN